MTTLGCENFKRGIKDLRISLGNVIVGRDVNTASMREQHLQKVAEEVKKL